MIVTNGTVITPEEELRGVSLVIENGKIKGIFPEDETIAPDNAAIDANGGYILPGLIDIHIHGGAGSDVMDSTPEDIGKICVFHASHGVTGLVATTITMPPADILHCIKTIGEAMKSGTPGSRILGVHLEGPFLSCGNRGAHPAEYLLLPKPENYAMLLDFAGIIKTITVAPELPGAERMIDDMHRAGIIISGGHDCACDDDILRAIDAGMTHTTHAFCAMSSLGRKNGRKHLGLNEMLLLDDRLTTEIIADNRHVTPLMAKLAYKCKGAKNMCIVSDCLRAAGMPAGSKRYAIGPRNFKGGCDAVVDDDVAMLPDRSMFAGSITTLDKMIKNLVEYCGIPLIDAVRMASLTPAEIIRIDKSKGSIEAGKDADLCIMDRQLNVVRTIVEGKQVFNSDKRN